MVFIKDACPGLIRILLFSLTSPRIILITTRPWVHIERQKAKLFTFASLKKAVINKDDEYAEDLKRLLSPNIEVKPLDASIQQIFA